ncbi:LuxR C-terminal-related transcriptional regulator [Actinoplanes sp. NPDC048796]|uniref:helix-turn-helix transcriptional regulator n=1 Tax=Actinoplanes sp. NPDC048796 TaxID=3155640 RepID=UPI0033EE9942
MDDTTLIGRAAEIDHLSRWLESAPGEPRVMVVTGGRGTGKSALLAAAVRFAHRANRHHVVEVIGDAGALLSVARRLLLQLHRHLDGLPPSIGEPALAVLGLGSPAAAPGPDEVLSVVRATVASVAATTPLLLVADDAHRLDDRLLALLTRVASTAPVAVLAATRLPSSAVLSAYPTLPLPALNDADAAELLDRRHRAVSARSRAAILHRSRGNPAALVELADPTGPLLHEYGAAIERLPAATRTLLHYAAATAQPADPALLAAAADVIDTDVWAAAERADLVIRTSDGIAFTHPLAAEAAYRDAPIHVRRRAHADLAAALTAHPERQAVHLAVAGPGSGEAVAARLEAAAKVFRGRGELFEATAAMQDAAERSPAPRDAVRRLAQAVADARDLRDTAWVTELHARVRTSTDDPDVLARTARPAATAMLEAGRNHEAYGIVVAALRAGATASPLTVTQLTMIAVAIAWLSCDDDHRAQLATVLPTVEALPHSAVAVLVREILEPATHPGRQLCDTLSAPPPAVVPDPADRHQAAVSGMIAWFEDRCRLAAGLLHAALGNDLTGRGLTSGLGTLPALVNALTDTGDWDQAARYAGPGSPGGTPAMEMSLASLRAQLHALRGENDLAVSLARQTWKHLDVTGNRAAHVRLLRACALAALDNGDHEEGYRYLRSMFDLGGRPLHPHLSARSVAELVLAAVRCDRLAEARTIVDQVRLGAGAEPSARMSVLLHLSEALLSDDVSAEAHFRRATEDPAGPEWLYEHAFAHLHYGIWLRRHRSTRDARCTLTYAADIFDRIGALGLAGVARREVSVGAPLAGGRRGMTLTTQEWQVAELAAQGLANKAIADQLLISARTVATHLSRVYQKTGISGRYQLETVIAMRSATARPR